MLESPYVEHDSNNKSEIRKRFMHSSKVKTVIDFTFDRHEDLYHFNFY